MTDEPVGGGPDEQWRKVRMSTALFMELGASRVDWGEPDAEGFYIPTVYKALPPIEDLTEEEDLA